MNITWAWRSFEELSTVDLHAILKLRQDVFIVEQKCSYADIDEADLQALHLLGTDADGDLVAYLRLFPPGVRCEEASIGRVVTAGSVRGKGLGHALMEQAVSRASGGYSGSSIRVNAQSHLVDFYEAHGFIVTGDSYVVDDILHQDLVRERTSVLDGRAPSKPRSST